MTHQDQAESAMAAVVFACREDNDLFVTLRTMGFACSRRATVAEAVEAAPAEGAVLCLADGYPSRRTELGMEVLEAAAGKKLRVVVEFPEEIPGMDPGETSLAGIERVVVASDAFGKRLEPLRILGLHGCRFVPAVAGHAHLVVGRVAGFDKTVFGLPEEAHPILFELSPWSPEAPELLVATTKLSQFVQGRYSPADAWVEVWRWIRSWATRGNREIAPRWEPAVRPRFRAEEKLPAEAEQTALANGVAWFRKSRLLVHPSWADKWEEAANYRDRVWDAPGEDWPVGDGTDGLLEGFSSNIDETGRQKIRWYLRGDCNAEAAMAHAFHARLAGDEGTAKVASNLLDYVFVKSNLIQGPRADPNSPSYGLIGWDTRPAGVGVYYGDDNAKLLLAAGGAASLLNNRNWEEKIVRAILANFRTSGKYGFRGHNLNEDPLAKNGWQSHFLGETTHFAPHFECWLWACYLWLYRQTGFELLLERSRTGLRMMMEAYPHDWHWTNGLQQERARMLLPLAWLVRVDDTAEHRGWLRKISKDLLACQEPCGAIREEVGSAGRGRYAPPASNAEYGTTEAPIDPAKRRSPGRHALHGELRLRRPA